MNTLQRTRDYTKFKTILGNRPINVGAVNKIITANALENRMWQFPGVVSKNGFLIDGQHRLAACEAQQWWFYYTVSDEHVDDDFLIKINMMQRAWKPSDFVHYFSERGNVQYKFLEEMKEKYKTSFANLVMMSGSKSNSALRKGKLVIYTTEEEKGFFEDMLQAYVDIKDYFSPRVHGDREFVGATRKIFQHLTSDQVIEAVQKSNIEFTEQSTVKDYLRLFEGMYNKGKSEKNQLRLF